MKMENANALRAQLVREFPPRPLIYWLDWGLCTIIGWSLFATACVRGMHALSFVLLAVSAVILLRSAYFVHDMAHLRRSVPGFELAWTLFSGAPVMVPTFMVEPHIAHHARESYGTTLDPEYEFVATWSPLQPVLSVLALVIVTPLLVLRFAVIAPLSWLIPPLRKLTVERLSTLASNAAYVRTMAISRRGKAQEVLYFAVAWLVIAGFVRGILPIHVAFFWWGVVTFSLMLNQARTNVAHAYEGSGAVMTLEEQVRDSGTVDGGNVLTDLVFPVGTRYHAIHHFAPTLPYHALPAAHRKLVALVGEGTELTHTRRATFLEAQRHLFRRALTRVSKSAPT
jgi:fatty acid desaturase